MGHFALIAPLSRVVRSPHVSPCMSIRLNNMSHVSDSCADLPAPCRALVLSLFFWLPAACIATVQKPVTGAPEVSSTAAGDEARQLVSWVRATGNNQRQPFAVIDKKHATLQVFDAAGKKLGSSPVLLGMAVGDDSVPGIGERPMSQILPSERTTPAGRFASEPGVNLQGQDIVWIDYDAAVSLHRVRAHNAAERRLQRLASPTAADNRISYGCVNVPVAFYDAFIQPVFGVKDAVIYVVPETRSIASVFGM